MCCESKSQQNEEAKIKNEIQRTLPKSHIEETIPSFELSKTKLIGHSKGNPNSIYIYQSKLGEGSFGSVFKVKHKGTGAIRAIKMIKKARNGSAPWINDLILNEIDLLTTLDHQNILKILEFYESDSYFYIVTEFCKGTELFKKLKCEGGQNEITTGIIMFQLFSGIFYCHCKNIMHRDLKPENIMIEENTKDGNIQIKIIDFGTATFYEKENCKKIIGTPYYMAPEVIGHNYNERCDLWSLGVIMYVLLKGKFPFGGKEKEQIFENIKKGIYDIKSPPFDRVSEEAKDLIRRLLVIDPSKRITAGDALNHPFFIKNKIKDKMSNLSTEDIQYLLKNILCYYPDKILQQAVIAYLVLNNQEMDDVHHANCLFAKIDKNNDGHISKQEFINAITSLLLERNERVDKNLLPKLFSIIDADNSGDIEYEEFVRAAINKTKFLDRKILRFAFDFFDNDKSGKITLDEVKGVFCKTKEFPDSDFQIIIDQVDSNNDGAVDFEEFCQMMTTILK